MMTKRVLIEVRPVGSAAELVEAFLKTLQLRIDVVAKLSGSILREGKYAFAGQRDQHIAGGRVSGVPLRDPSPSYRTSIDKNVERSRATGRRY